jgi:hypothetical protein
MDKVATQHIQILPVFLAIPQVILMIEGINYKRDELISVFSISLVLLQFRVIIIGVAVILLLAFFILIAA